MSENITPEPEETELPAEGEAEVQAHSAEEVLDLQKLQNEMAKQGGIVAFSCSSCGGASCIDNE